MPDGCVGVLLEVFKRGEEAEMDEAEKWRKGMG